jgi:hypothetical protein
MPVLRLFALLLAVLSLKPAFAQEVDPSQIADPSEMQDQVLPPAPPPPEEGYVPRRYRQEQPTPVRLPVSAAIPASFFAGRWGQVSFNTAEDLPKMSKVAREYCNLPVNITLNSPETFMMYVATELKEVQVFEQSGSLYVIPIAQLSDGVIRGARELHIIDNNTFTLRYLEDEAHRHYGPNVFVRCGAAKASTLPHAKEDSTPATVKKSLVKKKLRQSKLPEAAKAPDAQPETAKAPVEEKKSE